MQRLRWVDRTFTFGLPPGWMYNVLERLRGTPDRIAAMVAGLPDGTLKKKTDGKWSVQEHIGHLIDLETTLHDPRIDDLIERKSVLRPWEGTNAMTDNAGHNNVAMQDLIKHLRDTRLHFVQRLSSLEDGIMEHQALHPRLQVMMRPVDMAFFVAEHDDHHLASIRGLLT